MMGSKTKVRIFTVVDVWRGIAAGAKNFGRLREAQEYMQRLRRHRNLLEDDVKLFETTIYVSSAHAPAAHTGT